MRGSGGSAFDSVGAARVPCGGDGGKMRTMTSMRVAAVGAVAVAGVLVLSACTNSPEPTGSPTANATKSATPVPTSTTTITATPTPSATPTAVPPAEGGDGGAAPAPISKTAAYNECVPWASISSSNPGAVTVNSEAESTIIRRADGQWFLHIPYKDPAYSSADPTVVVCVIGGSDAAPEMEFANRQALVEPFPFSPDTWEDDIPID